MIENVISTFESSVNIANRCLSKGRRLWLGEARDNRRWQIKRYLDFTGRMPNLDQPKGFLEKLLWLNLYYRDSAIPPLVDKWLAREQVIRRIGFEVLNELLGVWDRPEDIPFDELPNGFVLKATAGCCWNIICHDKSKLDFQDAVIRLRGWQRTNYYFQSREWQYKSLRSKIIAERLMVDPTRPGRSIPDMKVFCFNGTPRIIGVNTDRWGDNRHDFFDFDWNPVDYGLSTKPRSNPPLEKPAQLARIFEVASTLSREFPFVRVDLYNHENKILFGEMTFSPSAGLMRIQMPQADEMWGSWLTLPTSMRRQ